MKNKFKPDLSCKNCFMSGKSYAYEDFVENSSLIIRRYHMCDNCGLEFYTQNDVSFNVNLKLILLRYIRKYHV